MAIRRSKRCGPALRKVHRRVAPQSEGNEGYVREFRGRRPLNLSRLLTEFHLLEHERRQDHHRDRKGDEDPGRRSRAEIRRIPAERSDRDDVLQDRLQVVDHAELRHVSGDRVHLPQTKLIIRPTARGRRIRTEMSKNRWPYAALPRTVVSRKPNTT